VSHQPNRNRPVVVGVGQVTDRVEAADQGREPLALAADALRAAAEDAGDGLGPQLLAELDSLDVVNVISWMYDDLPGLLAKAVGASPSRAEHSDWGGHRPTLLLDRAAARIARGESRIAAVVGAEALRSVELALRGGQLPPWTPPPAGAAPPDAKDHVHPLAWAHGLRMPTDVYPLFENALRATTELTEEANQAWSARLWASMSGAAAQNPDAWDPTGRTAEEIMAVGPRNRMVCHPYPKLMNARIGVNQAAAALVIDAELADDLGIPEEHRVSPVAGAGANDPDDFLERVAYDRSPAMEATLEATLQRAGLAVAECELLELYSCFPCVPKLAIRALGLPGDVDPSVTGGLTSFGGPGNDYMLHAIVAMVRAMRQRKGTTGLLYGNGGFLTKHHAMVLAAGTAAAPYAPDGERLDAALQADVDALPAPAFEEHPEGPATIEAWTAMYDGDGQPTVGVVVCRTGAGTRTVAHVTDDLDRLLDGQPVGAPGAVTASGEVNVFRFA